MRRAAFFLVLVLAPASAQASPLDVVGYDPETGAMAGSAIAFGKSVGVLQTNPALLTRVPEQVHLSLTLALPRAYIRPMPRPPGSDVPISIYGSDVGVTPGVEDRALPTVDLLNRRGDTLVSDVEPRVGLGVVSSFGLKRLRAALLVQVPVGGAASIQTHYTDEREAAFSNRLHFARFFDQPRVAAFNLGLGYDIGKRLSLGLSLEMAAAAVARLRVYIPDAAVQDHSHSNLESDVSLRWRPVIGARFLITDDIAVGAAFRNESSFRVDGASEVQLWNSHEPGSNVPRHTTQAFPAVFGWRPMEVALGAGMKKGPFTFQLAATWQRWSHFIDHHAEKPEVAAQAPASPYPRPSIDPERYEWNDTLAVHGSVAWRMTPSWETTVGGAYFPSPVPAQVGRTNYVDSALVGGAIGERYDFDIAGKRFAVSLTLQLWGLAHRTTHKDPSQVVDEMPDDARTLEARRPMPEAAGLQTNNPGYPGYTAGGLLGGASLAVSHLFP